MKIIDAEKTALGRLASETAKLLLNGETVIIVNAEKAVITGNPESVYEEWKKKFEIRDIAKPIKSPKLSRRPDLFVKRTIRGMVPRKTKRGMEAMRRVKAFIGVPEEYSGKAEKIIPETKAKKYITIEELCKRLGWKG